MSRAGSRNGISSFFQEQSYNISMIISKQPKSEIVIDLTGPDGNAFALMGYASRFAKDLDFSKEEIDELMKKMQSGDYENLVKVFDEEFGYFVVLER